VAAVHQARLYAAAVPVVVVVVAVHRQGQGQQLAALVRRR
jgi:hypothetical protein